MYRHLRYRSSLFFSIAIPIIVLFGVWITGCNAVELPTSTHPPLPTSGPRPLVTPVPTVITIAPTSTLTPTHTPIPTPLPTPIPTLTSTSGLSNAGVFNLSGGISLFISPERPIAGREVEFTLTGLSPWETVEVTFSDPYGQIAGWIGDAEYTYVPGPHTVFADRNGTVSWTRYGIQDVEGNWEVAFNFGNQKESVNYELEELGLSGLEWFYLGPRMNGLIGQEAGVFFSDDVTEAIATDVQARLTLASAQMEQILDIGLGAVPDVYLVGGQATLDLLSRATLVDIGWEGGYYRSHGFKPGIYINANRLRADLESILVHEYIHHVNRELVGSKYLPVLPIWLNEGIAEFYKYELGLGRTRPDAFRRPMISGAYNAKSAAISGSIFPLSSLENGAEWNNRAEPEEIALQYDQSYMCVRYMAEKFGLSSPFNVLNEISTGADFPKALRTAIGVTYEEFESGFISWISAWDDPERSGVQRYFQELDVLLAKSHEVNKQRNAFLKSGASNNYQAYGEWIANTSEIIRTLAEVTPPEAFRDLHTDVDLYFELMARWLILGQIDSVEEANELIPELNVRKDLINMNLDSAKFVRNLPGSSLSYSP